MRLLLLGKTGFIGRNMFASLSKEAGLTVDAPSHADLDALDERSVFNHLRQEQYDIVLNCLDSYGPADAAYAERRLRAFHNISHHSDLYGKMIYFGSGAEYGRQLPLNHVSEDDFGRIIPDDSYGFALYQMSEFALRSSNIFNLRLFGIFGPYERWESRFISYFICCALLNIPFVMHQNRIMDYLYVDDLVEIVKWAMSESPRMHAYNATSGMSISLEELAGIIREQTGTLDRQLAVEKPGLGPEYTSSNSALCYEMNGFMPKPIGESIAKLINYYKLRSGDIDCNKLINR